MKKPSPKTVYWTTYGLTLVVCLALPLFYYLLGGPRLGDFSQILSIPVTVAPLIVANVVCRRLGLSKAGQQIEIIWRGDFASQSENCAAVELKSPKRHWIVLSLVYALFTVAILALLFLMPGTGKRIGFSMAAIFALVALLCGFLYRKNNLIACADAEGVQGKDTHKLQSKLIVWPDIQSCEITVLYGVLGDLHHTNFVFKSNDGNALLSLMTAGIPEAQTGAFKNVIECYLSFS